MKEKTLGTIQPTFKWLGVKWGSKHDFENIGTEGFRAHLATKMMEATVGFEPTNRGFADPRLRPLGYVALGLRFGAEEET